LRGKTQNLKEKNQSPRQKKKEKTVGAVGKSLRRGKDVCLEGKKNQKISNHKKERKKREKNVKSSPEKKKGRDPEDTEVLRRGGGRSTSMEEIFNTGRKESLTVRRTGEERVHKEVRPNRPVGKGKKFSKRRELFSRGKGTDEKGTGWGRGGPPGK